ncbi:MAG: site-2 protease family protein [Chloroflexota bacterium]
MQRGQGFRIGRLFGIDIRIEWTWLIIFALVTYSLGGMLGEVRSEWGPTLRWGLAVLASLLFFGSVLAHELAHSLVSQARGNPVDSITLFLFGGMASIREEPDTPQSEFLMAIMGPLTSIIIGLGFLLAGALMGGSIRPAASAADIVGQLGPVQLMLVWLGSVNVTLGVFNMIPGFPLDGGRVLRSILWAITDNLRSATRWAAWVGQGFGWLMVMSGISMIFGIRIPFLGTGLGNGLWLAFIGWYLNNASAQSYQRVVVEDLLRGVPVQRIMRKDAPTVSPSDTVEGLVYQRIMGTDEHAFPVVDREDIVGIVTLEDVRAVPRDAWTATTVQEIMTPYDQCAVLNPHDDAADAMSKLSRCDVRQLPVLENGRLTGVLRRQDLIQWLRLQSGAHELGPRSGVGSLTG